MEEVKNGVATSDRIRETGTCFTNAKYDLTIANESEISVIELMSVRHCDINKL